jgi:hypothetical protein
MEDVVDVEQPLQVEAGARVHAQVRPPIIIRWPIERYIAHVLALESKTPCAARGNRTTRTRPPSTTAPHRRRRGRGSRAAGWPWARGHPRRGERGRGSAGRPGPRRVRLPITHLTQGFITSALFGGCFLRRTLQDPKGLAHKTLVLTVIGTLSWAELGRISYVRAYDFRS